MSVAGVIRSWLWLQMLHDLLVITKQAISECHVQP